MDPLAISDSDAERVLRGQTPAGPGLSRLVAVIDELRAVGSRAVGHEVHPRLVAMAAAAALDSTPREPAPAPSTAHPTPGWRLVPRLATSMAALAVVMGMTGVAVASDAAAPGEPLHGVDVFLERLGIGDGGASERVQEAQELTSRGLPAEALDHLSTTLAEEEDSQAREALQTAAERLKADRAGSANAERVRERVSQMLEWMATTDATGNDFGQGVAERVKSLGDDELGPALTEENGPPGQVEQGQVGPSNAGKGNGKGKGGRPPGKGR